MVDAMVHRGPDSRGELVDEARSVGLGHCRLSILDLSDAGRQPMTDESGRYTIVYNGEVYNFRKLREELQREGWSFRTQTDTEVILYAFRQWGPECLRRLRGMFALAIYDRGPAGGPDPRSGASRLPEEPYLFLARDRLGIKPLIYTQGPSHFAFASELRGLAAAGLLPREVSAQAVGDFLRFGSAYQPDTFFPGVHTLPPGSAMIVKGLGQATESWPFWSLPEQAGQLSPSIAKADYEDMVAITRDALDDAARAHLVADVPVGAFLSGGIDSAAVTALITKHAGTGVHSFSVGFEGNQGVTDELPLARKTARALGCTHTDVVMSLADVPAIAEEAISALDQPSVDGTNTCIVSRAAATSHKVVLSGLGGDELFAGYPHFATFSRAETSPPTAVDRMLAHVHGLRPNRFTYQAYYNALPRAGRLAAFRRLFTDRALRSVVSRDAWHSFAPATAHQEGLVRRELDPVAQVSYAECRLYLQSTLLRDTDIMSMRHSLEVRPILLDHKLAELALALPPAGKLRSGMHKAVLIDAVRDLIPSHCWETKKSGFELPFGRWLTGPLRDTTVSSLESPQALRLLSPRFRRRTIADVRNGRADRRTWGLFVLFTWLQQTGTEVAVN